MYSCEFEIVYTGPASSECSMLDIKKLVCSKHDPSGQATSAAVQPNRQQPVRKQDCQAAIRPSLFALVSVLIGTIQARGNSDSVTPWHCLIGIGWSRAN